MKLEMDILSNSISFAVTASSAILAIFFIKLISEAFQINGKKKYAPLAGTILIPILNFNRVYDVTAELCRKYKTFRILSPLGNEIHTVDPVNVEYILKTNFPNYGKGWYNYNILTDLLGDGIFTVDGEKWRHQRKTASYEFSTKILRDFSSEVFRGNAQKLAEIVSKAAAANQPVDVQDLFMKSTLDSVFKVVLGVELDSMCGTYEEGAIFSKAFNEASELTAYRYISLLWKIKRFFNIGSEAKLKECVKIVDNYVYKLIQAKVKQFEHSPNQSSELKKKGDILSRFLESNETDPKYLKDIILSFIIAGKDTTGSTLSWFLYMMCKHPLIQEKIVQEVWEATKIKENSSHEELVAGLTEEALDKMQYLHAALSETLRLYPAVPADRKVCFSDDTFPDGSSVTKGDLVTYHPYAMGRMEDLWGNDAEEFRPERWFDQDGVFQHQSSFKFTAFQAGPRICLGKEFAYRQMKIFSAVLIGCYKFKLSEMQKRVHYKVMLTLHIDGGLHLQAFHRLRQS